MEKKEDIAKKALMFGILFMVFHTFMSLARAQMTYMIPPLMRFMTESMGISLGQIGNAQQIATTVMGIGVVFGSILIDKIGPSRSMVVGILLCASCGILVYFAPSYTSLFIGRVILGLGLALTFPVSNALVMERFQKQSQRGLCNSLIQGTNALANTLTYSMSVPIFMALNQSWSNQMGMWGGVLAVLAVIFFVADQGPKKFFATYGPELAGARPVAAGNAPAPESGSSLKKAMGIREMRAAAVAFTGATWLYTLFMTYLSTVLQTVHGMTPAEAGSNTSLISSAGVVACVLCGLFIGRLKNYRLPMLLLTVLLLVSGVSAMLVPPGFALKLSVILLGVSWFCFVPVVNTATMGLPGVTPKVFAAGSAMRTLSGNVLSMLIPTLFDLLQKNMGMQKAVLVLSLVGVFAIVGSLMFPSGKKAAA